MPILFSMTDDGNLRIPIDGEKLLFGQDDSAFISYDGLNFNIGFTNPSFGQLTQLVKINDDLLVQGQLSIGTVPLDESENQLLVMGNDQVVKYRTSYDAEFVDIVDEGNYFDDDNVEDAIQDLANTLFSLTPPTPPFIEDRDARTGSGVTTSQGKTGNLTWDSTHAFSDYFAVAAKGDNSPIDAPLNIDVPFIKDLDSTDRAGIFNDGTPVVGRLNIDVLADTNTPTPSYSLYAFAEGSLAVSNWLVLEINGSENSDSKVFLTDPLADDTTVGTSSGFDISEQLQIKFANGDDFNSYYRTGTWKVDPTDMHHGHNYVRVLHYIDGAISTSSNYADWVVDDDETPTSYSNSLADLHDLTMSGSQYLSGIRYHTSGLAHYDVKIDNAFRNTYIAGDVITYNTSRGTMNDESIGVSSGDQTTQVSIEGVNTFTVNSQRHLDATISASTNVNRVFDDNENDPGNSGTIDGLLMDPYILGAVGQSDTAESFNAEGYRQESEAGGVFDLTDTDYATGGISKGPAPWANTESLVGADDGHNNGLLQYNSKLTYPKSTPDSGVINGDFRNVGGSGYEEGYTNPNYSGASGNKVYLRYFYVGDSKANFVFTISGHNFTGFTTVAIGPNGQDLTLELLAPNTTSDAAGAPPSGTIEFKDCHANYDGLTNDGCYTSGTRDADTSDWTVTLGTRSTATSGNTIVIRITAADTWTGYIDSISVAAS